MIAVTFALPDESIRVRRALSHAGVERSAAAEGWRGMIAGREVLLTHTGVGAEAATAAARALLDEHAVQFVVSAGYAGGLEAWLGRGDLFLAENRSDPRLILCADTALAEIPGRVHRGALASTAAPVESPNAKNALRRKAGAAAVDMETEAIAQVCEAARVPMLSVRAISDTSEDALPVPFAEWFDMQRQRPRIVRLLRHLALHPGTIPAFAKFVRGLAKPRAALADAIPAVLAALPR
jgi:adenosylhomocysteine nucleosidase